MVQYFEKLFIDRAFRRSLSESAYQIKSAPKNHGDDTCIPPAYALRVSKHYFSFSLIILHSPHPTSSHYLFSRPSTPFLPIPQFIFHVALRCRLCRGIHHSCVCRWVLHLIGCQCNEMKVKPSTDSFLFSSAGVSLPPHRRAQISLLSVFRLLVLVVYIIVHGVVCIVACGM